MTRRRMSAALLCGIFGCICFGGGDWLMIFGDAAPMGSVPWLTAGAAQIASWRNGLAMALAFPGILLYGIALFALGNLLRGEGARRVYRCLTAFSLTPWLCLHLFYVMILYLFAWMTGRGFDAAAMPAAEALLGHLGWIVAISEAMMLPPYLCWAYLLLRGRSALPRGMAAANPLVFYGALKLLSLSIASGPLRIGFTNGLMSESMAIWFAILLAWVRRRDPGIAAEGGADPWAR